jgi:receptor-type tyrosine-protein phosphatase R
VNFITGNFPFCCSYFSAGIGRTGCFIAISIGVRQLQEEQMIDVLGIVCQMRLDR